MSDSNPKTGTDAWTDDAHPKRPRPSGNTIRLLTGSRRGWIHIPLTNIRGRTLETAFLVGRVRSGFVAQDVTAHLPSDKWDANTITDHNKPSTTHATTTSLTGTFADGDAVLINVLPILSAVAAGTVKYRGIMLSTDADTVGESHWYAFDSGELSWEYAIEYADELEAPTGLHPSGDYIGSTAPVLGWSPWDLGGSSAVMGEFQVQADPDADEVSPAFDSGWVSDDSPEFDLSASSFTPLTAGQVLRWRVRTRNAAGTDTSDWSDWTDASEYQAMPVLVADSPTGGAFGDATPVVAAHMTGETMTRWRLRVHDAAFETLYDSGQQTGPFDIEVPFRDPDSRRRIIRHDDVPYTFDMRAWGTRARADTIGVPAYAQVLVTATYDDDLGVVAPDSYSATQVGDSPVLEHSWHRSTGADGWIIGYGDRIVHRLDGDDPSVLSGVYTWRDDGESIPYVSHQWWVRAVDDGSASAKSNTVTRTLKPRGVWLVPESSSGIDPIRLRGDVALDSFARNDRRSIYQPLGTGVDVDIVDAQEGVSGSFEGTVRDEPGLARTVLGDDGDVDRIQRLARDVAQRPRLVWASRSIRVKVRDLAALPHSTFEDTYRRHRVVFSFQEDGD